MKKLGLLGWAVIFAATTLLAACATHDAQMARTEVMSGSDVTMAQQEDQDKQGDVDSRQSQFEQMKSELADQRLQLETREAHLLARQGFIDELQVKLETKQQELGRRENALAIDRAWVNEMTSQLAQRNEELERGENALAIDRAWMNEMTSQLAQRNEELERGENALAIDRAWVNEMTSQLAQRNEELERGENALAIDRAWVNEMTSQLAQRNEELERGENALAINQAWLHEHERQQAQFEETTKRTLTASLPMKAQAGHCYASVFVPATYKTVAVTKLIEPPSGNQTVEMSQYQTVMEQRKVTDERMVWKEILCESRATQDMVSDIQHALSEAGYNPGPIDGIMGQQTMKAVNAFQKTHNLTVANHLTIETIKALGVNY